MHGDVFVWGLGFVVPVTPRSLSNGFPNYGWDCRMEPDIIDDVVMRERLGISD